MSLALWDGVLEKRSESRWAKTKFLRHGFGLEKNINRCNSWDRGCTFCALIIMNHMYVVLLGSNLGKSQRTDLSGAESWPKHRVLAQFLRQKGVRHMKKKKKVFFFLIIACEDIKRSSWLVAKRVQFLSGPWPYHTTAQIPNQVVQRRESQSERWFGTRSRLCGGNPLNCVPNVCWRCVFR